MRKLLIFTILIFIVFSLYSDGIFVNDSYISVDKIDHFFTTFILTAGSYICVKSMSDIENEGMRIGLSVSLPTVLSIAKEIYDGFSEHGEVSYKDLIYDGLGILMGILIVR